MDPPVPQVMLLNGRREADAGQARPSPSLMARILPSGLNATDPTLPLLPVRRNAGRLLTHTKA